MLCDEVIIRPYAGETPCEYGGLRRAPCSGTALWLVIEATEFPDDETPEMASYCSAHVLDGVRGALNLPLVK